MNLLAGLLTYSFLMQPSLSFILKSGKVCKNFIELTAAGTV